MHACDVGLGDYKLSDCAGLDRDDNIRSARRHYAVAPGLRWPAQRSLPGAPAAVDDEVVARHVEREVA